MTTALIVVEHLSDWHRKYDDNSQVVSASDYVTQQHYLNTKDLRVINLCRHYEYLSIGYYCSLLAEARGHKVIPTVKTILEVENSLVYKQSTKEIELLVKKELSHLPPGEDLDVGIFFGRTDYPQLTCLAAKIFEQFRCPLLRVKLHFSRRWRITSLHTFSINAIKPAERQLFLSALHLHTRKRWLTPKVKRLPYYDLAILHNPDDRLGPSDQRVLDKFIRIGKSLGIYVELIHKKDLGRLVEFDALFIRETTGIDHHTFNFAKRADHEGLVVIDDPESIFRCTNKVFLAELLKTHKICTPKTVIFEDKRFDDVEKEISYPIVLKIPDGSFSRGVSKVTNREELEQRCKELFLESDILLAQEYIYTDFDWRVGVLNNKPIYACKYFMSKKHWQIFKYSENGKQYTGSHQSLPLSAVPPEVIKAALAASRLIGDGFYGVDLKQKNNKVYVIEVNDNPSINFGVEDQYLKDELYRIILQEFIRRLDLKRAVLNQPVKRAKRSRSKMPKTDTDPVSA